jgi:serine/threonine-protein kinase RsbW
MPRLQQQGRALLPDPDALVEDVVRYRLRAVTEEVRHVLKRVRARYRGTMSYAAAWRVEMTLAEVLNNIVEHAYATAPPGRVVLTLQRFPARLACEAIDHGKPMPDFRIPLGTITEPPDDRAFIAEGGWGWAMIRSLTTHLSYQRVGPANRLRFDVPLLDTMF